MCSSRHTWAQLSDSSNPEYNSYIKTVTEENTFTSNVEQWQRGQIIASVCTASQASRISHIPESLGWDWGSKIPPTVSKEQVWDQLMRLNMY